MLGSPRPFGPGKRARSGFRADTREPEGSAPQAAVARLILLSANVAFRAQSFHTIWKSAASAAVTFCGPAPGVPAGPVPSIVCLRRFAEGPPAGAVPPRADVNRLVPHRERHAGGRPRWTADRWSNGDRLRPGASRHRRAARRVAGRGLLRSGVSGAPSADSVPPGQRPASTPGRRTVRLAVRPSGGPSLRGRRPAGDRRGRLWPEPPRRVRLDSTGLFGRVFREAGVPPA